MVPAIIEVAAKEQKLDLQEVNILLPSQTFGSILGEFDKITLEVIKIDSNARAGEVFEISDNKYSLGKVPLERIANALSIQWHPTYTGIIESTPLRSRAKAVGMMRKPNGETITQTDEKTIDLEVTEEELRERITKEAAKGKVVLWENGLPKRGAWSSEREKDEYIEREVKRGLMQKRKFKDELALTGAKDRVIRAFIAIKNTYSKEELAKPFAFPRVSLDTSKMLGDERTRKVALEKMDHATQMLYNNNPESQEKENT